MKSPFFYLICFFLMCLFLFSCASKEDIIYFQDNYSPQKDIGYLKNYPLIRPYDKLFINISSSKSNMSYLKEMDLTQGYNLSSNLSTVASSHKHYYVVSKNGFIKIPNTKDSIFAIGMNRFEIAEMILSEIKKNEKDKVLENDFNVNVNYVDFRINVIGEVNKPGSYIVDKDRINIIEAIALSGDLTIQGNRKNIKVVRETDSQSKVFTVDLTSNSVFDSEVFFLKQNDVVYIEPNYSKIQTSVTNYSTLLSVAGVLISIAAILIK